MAVLKCTYGMQKHKTLHMASIHVGFDVLCGGSLHVRMISFGHSFIHIPCHGFTNMIAVIHAITHWFPIRNNNIMYVCVRICVYIYIYYIMGRCSSAREKDVTPVGLQL